MDYTLLTAPANTNKSYILFIYYLQFAFNSINSNFQLISYLDANGKPTLFRHFQNPLISLLHQPYQETMAKAKRLLTLSANFDGKDTMSLGYNNRPRHPPPLNIRAPGKPKNPYGTRDSTGNLYLIYIHSVNQMQRTNASVPSCTGLRVVSGGLTFWQN